MAKTNGCRSSLGVHEFMIWIPALAALGAMRSNELEWERRHNISQSEAAAVVARQQIAFQCDLFETTCQRIRMWTRRMMKELR